jgi:hypothetical protein
MPTGFVQLRTADGDDDVFLLRLNILHIIGYSPGTDEGAYVRTSDGIGRWVLESADQIDALISEASWRAK